jgi:MFS transporter, FSR family, fosmidomycin resistance protein
VLYGTVPELSDGDTGRAFAVFYTSVIGSGGIAPILYGAVADHSNRTIGVLASAVTAADRSSSTDAAAPSAQLHRGICKRSI